MSIAFIFGGYLGLLALTGATLVGFRNVILSARINNSEDTNKAFENLINYLTISCVQFSFENFKNYLNSNKLTIENVGNKNGFLLRQYQIGCFGLTMSVILLIPFLIIHEMLSTLKFDPIMADRFRGVILMPGFLICIYCILCCYNSIKNFDDFIEIKSIIMVNEIKSLIKKF